MNAPIGASLVRREDARFLIGRGAYLDDLPFPGALRAVVLRSPHAHASLTALDAAAARALPGVRAVLTAAELAADGIGPLLPTVQANPHTGAPFAFAPQPLLAADRVRYVGEPVALILADTLAQALDGAEAVAVRYEPLPAITDADAARAPGAPLLAAEAPGNLALAWDTGDAAAVAAAFAAAAHVVRRRVVNHRVVINPMEPRGAVAAYDPATGRTTLHLSSQSLYAVRDAAAGALGQPPTSLRVIAPDVGGGFGAKNFPYPEHALIAWAARRAGRPVKWIATRSELFLADHQARDHVADAALALDAEGRFLALEVASRANLGAYMAGGSGAVQTFQYAHLPGGAYAIPAVALHIEAVFTNTAPIGVTRGPGFAEANAIIERLIDAAASQTGLDRLELRRRNLAPASPFTNALGHTVDSGDFRVAFEAALTRADQTGFPARRAASAARGLWRGLGVAYHIKATGGAPRENVEIRFLADGTVALLTGTQTIGQGHETSFPQILAGLLGVPASVIALRQGDTDLLPLGGGHGSSRATYMAGTAMVRASAGVIAKATPIAAHALSAPVAEVSFAHGLFRAAGTNRAIGLLEVAALARDVGTPLDTYDAWTREAMTFPNGCHIAEVEIDPETGVVRLDRYTAVDDYGVQINPRLVAGQAHGAIAQGAGQALTEQAAYDPASGQPLTGSFMDYALPRAADLPEFDLAFAATRCTTNPLGVKGAGEAAAVGAFPAIGNAIRDALAACGVTALPGAATPFAVWRAIQAAGRMSGV